MKRSKNVEIFSSAPAAVFAAVWYDDAARTYDVCICIIMYSHEK